MESVVFRSIFVKLCVMITLLKVVSSQGSACSVRYPLIQRSGFIGTTLGHTRAATQVIIPDATFTSCGQITSWTMATMCNHNVNSRWTVQLQVWQPGSTSGTYTLRTSENVFISFVCDNVLVTFNTTRLSFKAGDILGLYTPVTSVDFIQMCWYRDPTSDLTQYYEVYPQTTLASSVVLSDMTQYPTRVPIVSVQVAGCDCSSTNSAFMSTVESSPLPSSTIVATSLQATSLIRISLSSSQSSTTSSVDPITSSVDPITSSVDPITSSAGPITSTSTMANSPTARTSSTGPMSATPSVNPPMSTSHTISSDVSISASNTSDVRESITSNTDLRKSSTPTLTLPPQDDPPPIKEILIAIGVIVVACTILAGTIVLGISFGVCVRMYNRRNLQKPLCVQTTTTSRYGSDPPVNTTFLNAISRPLPYPPLDEELYEVPDAVTIQEEQSSADSMLTSSTTLSVSTNRHAESTSESERSTSSQVEMQTTQHSLPAYRLPRFRGDYMSPCSPNLESSEQGSDDIQNLTNSNTEGTPVCDGENDVHICRNPAYSRRDSMVRMEKNPAYERGGPPRADANTTYQDSDSSEFEGSEDYI